MHQKRGRAQIKIPNSPYPKIKTEIIKQKIAHQFLVGSYHSFPPVCPITNWHVASGFDSNTKQALSSHGGVPDKLNVSFFHTGLLHIWGVQEISLVDNEQRPIWLEHPRFRSRVDVVAIPFTLDPGLEYFPLNGDDIEFQNIPIEIGGDVFIIGYPLGITGAGRLPIWKRGTIASEPALDLDGLPKLLIDTATRQGMSGSPVIANYNGLFLETSGVMTDTDYWGEHRKFLGVYSGRVGEGHFEAQLGVVWKASVVEDIITKGIRPD
jgi:hypothetical protein